MHRAIPVANKACAERVRQRNHELHRQRMRQMRPQVDTSQPSTCQMDHLRNNLKREQLLEERYHEIDRENRILLQKMSDIMRTPPASSSTRAASGPPSLNRDSRKVELMRITSQNQGILKRIQRAQPVYNHVAWEDSYRRSQEYLKNSSEYPLVLKRKASRGSGLLPLSGADGEFSQGGSATAPASGGQETADGDAKYVLKEGRLIGQQYYLVEMATDGRTLTISAYDGDNNKSLELMVNEKNHRRLFRETNGDYNALAERLHIDNGSLKLDMGSDAVLDRSRPASGGRVGPNTA